MKTKVKVLQDVMFNKEHQKAGTILELDKNEANFLVGIKRAERVEEKEEKKESGKELLKKEIDKKEVVNREDEKDKKTTKRKTEPKNKEE